MAVDLKDMARAGDGLGPRRYPDRDLKLLFGWSAGRCGFHCCRDICLEPATPLDRAAVIGIIAHIEAHSNGGPRANPHLTLTERDRYENWILLCSKHHNIVDNQPNTYTSVELRQWKTEHERWVEERLQETMPRVTFAELKVVALAILESPDDPSEAYELTPPVAKMTKNGLTGRSRNMLKLGLAKSKDVEHFVQYMAVINPKFPERLKAGFVEEYNALRAQEIEGDALFEGLKLFATGASTEFDVQCAGLAVLSYMFEKCEIFEP